MRPVWSPDGRTILFERAAAQARNAFTAASCFSVFRVGRDGRGVRRVTRPVYYHEQITPALSPDGKRVAYTDVNSCEAGSDYAALRVVDLSGHRTRDLAQLPGNKDYRREYWSATWSPDGKRLAFFSRAGLVVASRDGSHLHTLSRLGISFFFWRWPQPAWSPDGTWIAFPGGNDHHVDLYVVHPDGTGLHRLAGTRDARRVSWLRQ